MDNGDNTSFGKRFFFFLKVVFLALMVIYFAPVAFDSARCWFKDTGIGKESVGCIVMSGSLTDAHMYTKHFDDFLKDSKIKALLLKIDSPGGYAGTSNVIFNELMRFKKVKPVVVLVENMCASGAYYIAVAANHIVASPMSLIGSVGTLVELPNVKELLSAWHISYTHVQSGEFKTSGSPFKKIEAGDREYFQNLCDNNYTQFVHDVALCRGLDEAAHAEWANGRVFTGNQALSRHLIDSLGSVSDAVSEIKKLANIQTEIKLVYPPKQSPVMKFLGYDDDGSDCEMSIASRCARFITHVHSCLTGACDMLRIR